MLGNYNIVGFADQGFEAVTIAFTRGFAEDAEIGAGLTAYYKGKKVVDLVGGWTDNTHSSPLSPHHVYTVHSAGKPLEGISLAHVVSNGLLKYDQKISDVWSGFATGGKSDVLVKDLMTHQSGVGWLDEPHWPHVEELCDLDALARRIEGQPHNFGGKLTKSYHGLTRGWFINEIIRRTLGTTHGDLMRKWGAKLGVDVFVGLPKSEDARFCRVHFTPELLFMFKSIKSLSSTLPVTKKTTVVGAVEPEEDGGLQSNVLDVLRGETSSTYTVTNAAGLAAFANVMAMGGAINDLTLVDHDTHATAHQVDPRNLDSPDAIAFAQIRSCIGGWAESRPGSKVPNVRIDFSSGVPSPYVPDEWKGDGWCWSGWDGLGGSILQWDRFRQCALSYAPTKLNAGGGITDERAARIMLAFVECVETLEQPTKA
ncbi:beta-lactamase/transpeptidase-like protein [Gonapodya prolifera JEL478]|uniref:Beta-lactamase/transpeptidase-like protein n=1 Tax=Gonapodya prolifera (strain JEL478) TaxID=1344416 RepID=A0A138ZX68_GONPJ|nr:beta-lactamase/transpeptidase-like protein [Gonapodya prolifera JEL478]|eukprot:KXS09087.1 beta-lactamase/transpeptidase-like protein [Gonapodya prolifera JEL478]